MDLAAAVLRAADLGEPGWTEAEDDDAEDGGPGWGLLAGAAELDLPAVALAGALDGPRLVLPPSALVWSTAALAEAEAGAAELEAALGEEAFAVAFAEAVALGAAPHGRTLLGPQVEPLPGGGWRTSFWGGDRQGVTGVHVDQLVRRSGAAVVVAWSADAPHPPPAARRQRIAAALAARLP